MGLKAGRSLMSSLLGIFYDILNNQKKQECLDQQYQLKEKIKGKKDELHVHDYCWLNLGTTLEHQIISSKHVVLIIAAVCAYGYTCTGSALALLISTRQEGAFWFRLCSTNNEVQSDLCRNRAAAYLQHPARYCQSRWKLITDVLS